MRTGVSSRWRELRSDLRCIPECLLAAGLLGAVFYRSAAASVLLIPAGAVYAGQRRKERQAGKQRVLAGQFRDALESVITSLKAGASPENAFRESRKEMVFQYGEDALISGERRRIENGLENRVPLEKLLEEFAKGWDIEEIREFAEVFAIVKRGGGNMVEVLGRTAEMLQERIEVEAEIQILLGNRKMEGQIMEMTPFLLVFYVGLTSPGFFDILYHNVTGILFMTACLAGYLAAYTLSERILDIRM